MFYPVLQRRVIMACTSFSVIIITFLLVPDITIVRGELKCHKCVHTTTHPRKDCLRVPPGGVQSINSKADAEADKLLSAG